MGAYKSTHYACDANLDKVNYPCIIMPKIDGVRGQIVKARVLGRTHKEHVNVHTQEHFGQDFLEGLDGEFVLNNRITSPSLCRDTTSAINTIEENPRLYLWCFDFLLGEMGTLPYKERLQALTTFVEELNEVNDPEFTRIRVVPHSYANSKEEVLSAYNKFLDQGYEGIIIRDPNGLHKNGRCTANEANYLRIKPTADAEAVVIGVIEGNKNENEATLNAIGKTERSSHKENLVPNGMVGSLLCKNSLYPEPFKVSAGCLTHEQRVYYFNNQEQIIGQTIKYKFMDHGEKDCPRQARFFSFRAPSDL